MPSDLITLIIIGADKYMMILPACMHTDQKGLTHCIKEKCPVIYMMAPTLSPGIPIIIYLAN